MLQISTISADNMAFTGSDGNRSLAIANRIGGAHSDLLAATVVRPGVEVRSSGDLTLLSDWHVSAGASAAGSAALPSAAITLRAAGNLLLTHSLSTGLDDAFNASAGALPSVPLANAGAIRLSAGADLASALPTATLDASAGGTLSLGRAGDDPFSAPPQVVVASSSGRIEMAAARDIQWVNNHAAVYTTGTALRASVPVIADLVGSLPNGTVQSADGQTLLSPFMVGGGNITLSAGQDVRGVPGSSYITDWWWRNPDTGAWWSRYRDLFNSGVATFGGGNVRISAGRDLVDVDASAANSGYAAVGSGDGARSAAVFGGGSVALRAGRDVLSGLASASGDRLSVQAGGAVKPSTNPGAYEALQVDYQNTSVRIEAAGDVTVGAIKSAGRLEPTAANDDAKGTIIEGLDDQARLLVGSWGGDLRYLDRRLGEQRSETSATSRVIPADAVWAALSGSVTLGDSFAGIVQRPVGAAGQLVIAAADNVSIGSVMVQPVVAASGVRLTAADDSQQGDFNSLAGSLGVGVLPPLRVLAGQGSIDLTSALESARPVRLIAGQDIVLDSPIGGLLIVHSAQAGNSPLTLLEAGRDIKVAGSLPLPFGQLVVRGGGDLLVLAGRNVDLGSSQGIVSRGNLDDSLGLPEGGAHLTVIAGLQTALGDYALAASRGFVLLGGAGVADRAADLAALLEATTTGQPLPAPGSAAAAAFAALTTPGQLDRARTLLGGANYDSALLAQMRALQGSTALTTAEQARTAFDALGAADQTRVLGAVLASGYDRLDAATQRAFVLQTVDPASTNARQLEAFVAQHGASGASSLAAALDAFDAMPLEQQALLANQVLFSELRSAGRAAASLGGSERDTAYARGYAALATVFPGVRPAGDIAMTTSQIKTQQGGSISLLAPGGGVDAGALASSAAPQPNTQGIVTVAGGDIQAAVRSNFAVNQSRVFTLAEGDILLWSSQGNLDAGRGAKTVRGAPKPVFGLDANGNVTIDTSGSFTGSGIAVLDANSSLDLYAPKGEINAGEAGIKSAGNAFFGAQRFVGTDNLSVGGSSVGAPPPVSTTGATAGLSSLGSSTTAAAARESTNDDDDKKRKRRRRNFFLDFLGFGQNQSD